MAIVNSYVYFVDNINSFKYASRIHDPRGRRAKNRTSAVC